MKTIVHIQNLKCGGCANTITKKLNALDDATLASWVRNGVISFINIHLKSLNNLQNLMNLLYQRNN